jgi:hypothetical protein
MDLNRKLAKRLVLGCVMTVCIGAALVVGKGKERLSNESNVGTPVEAMGWETELAALLRQPNGLRMDIARMNLLAGSGLARGEDLAFTNLVRELAAMTARVKAETARHVARFQRAPEEFSGSEAYFKMLCLVTVLQQDFGIRYSPQRAQPVEGRIEPNESFYSEAADVFLHGLLGPRRTGTCASLPVLYAAVGRRLGYPLKLVTAKNHLFVRWDGAGERLNIEATTEGMTTFEDEYYRGWPFPMSPEEEQTERYLTSLSPVEELSVFLSLRTHCLLAAGRFEEAASNQEHVCRLAPHSAIQREFMEHLRSNAKQSDRNHPNPRTVVTL